MKLERNILVNALGEAAKEYFGNMDDKSLSYMVEDFLSCSKCPIALGCEDKRGCSKRVLEYLARENK